MKMQERLSEFRGLRPKASNGGPLLYIGTRANVIPLLQQKYGALCVNLASNQKQAGREQ